MVLLSTRRKTALITGVAGFIGSRLAQAMVAQGFRVIGIDDLSKGRPENVPNEVALHTLGLHQGDLNFLPKKIDVVLHLAGQSSSDRSFSDPVDDLQRNALSTVKLLESISARDIGTLLFASSMAVYGNPDVSSVSEQHVIEPISPYGLSKQFGEKAIAILNPSFPTVVFRMFNVYGPGQDLKDLGQGMVSIFLAQALETNSVVVRGALQRVRDFIFIDDVVQAWMRAIWEMDKGSPRSPKKRLVLNLGTGTGNSVGRLLEEIKLYFPTLKVSVAAPTMGDPRGFFADMSEFAKRLGPLSTTSLKDGVQKTVRAELQQP